ncbi:MAG: glycosyl hydrolase family 8, partial [Actinomycetota bacterium]|nr:glycosyl hydrolase family 8 [Actinomycetota bacterium]
MATTLIWAVLPHHQQSQASRQAQQAARLFLDNWTDPDGRVVRRDQGGDSVSEGQAYGMLLAVVARDQGRFDLTWKWTAIHLQQADGLLAWRWSNGKVADEQSAADADIDAAWALSQAAVVFSRSSYANDSKRIAEAALAHETVPTTTGRLLIAGPWATSGGQTTLNPSYLIGSTATMLGSITGDQTWLAVADSTRTLDQRLVTPTSLPPDWARLPAGAPASQVVP